jgi:ABC-2 type transport system permease protein
VTAVAVAPTVRRGTTRRIGAHAGWETRLLLRNGEQLLLTFAIPLALLVGLTLTSLLPGTGSADRVARALATVLAVSVLSSAFASLAIATGFERRSGALRFLGTTPLSRSELLAGKVGATGLVTVLSSGLAIAGALVLGWHPTAAALWILPILLLGIGACAAWGMALAGLLRAEAVLAVANGIFLLLLMFGGVVIPAAALPGPLAAIAPWLPSGALVEAFTGAVVQGTAPSVASTAVLLAWLAAGTALSVRTFRWT